jgi:hypothetical protein
MHWGAAVALVYAAFAASTVGMVVIASTHHADLVSDDYYEQSLSFDRRIAAEARGRTARVDIVVDASARRLRITWPSDLVRNRPGTITLYRPAGRSADRVTALAADAGGVQTLDVAGVPAGHWIVRLEWTAADGDYYVSRAVRLP